MGFMLIGFVLSHAAALLFFTGRSWRWNLVFMGLIYLGVFLLLLNVWPLELAAIKLVGGWMATAVLGATRRRETASGSEADAGGVFRFLVFSLLLLAVWSSAPGAIEWIPNMTFEMVVPGTLLAASGLVRSGMVREPLEVVASVLASFAGFELIYATVDSSALLAALLAVGSLGLALGGAYLDAGAHPEESESGL